MIKYILTIFIITSYTFAAVGDGKDGYWNYEIITTQTKTTTEELPQAPNKPPKLPTTEILMQMHPDQIQVLTKSWRKWAIYTLEPTDVSEALRIQDVARKKASSYAAVVGFVNQTNPDLSLADEVPITNAGMQAQYSMRQNAMDNYLENNVKHYGLLYFSSRNCEFCRIQDGILEQLLAEFDFDITVVEFEKEPLMVSRFNIRQTPSIIIVNRASKKHLPVSFGATSLPELTENIYRAMRYIQQEITPTQFFTNERDINTGLDPNFNR
jgi:hypothetical protein